MRFAVLVVCLFGILAGGVWPTAAGALDLGAAQERRLTMDPAVPWNLEADRIRYDQASDEYVAEGNAVITKQGRRISADTMRFNRQAMMAYAEGHVVVSANDDVLSGEYLELDMESELGHLDQGMIFIKENNYHIQGNIIQKTGADSYWIDKGTVTTCDGETPDWKISGRDVNVTEDGAGSAWNATLYARDMPVAYFPYVRFPARGRQTGLLIPQFGYYEKKGFSWNQPFFWAIDDHSDATFYLQYMSERGWKPGVEYRYFLNREARGAIMFDFLDDDKVDDGGPGSSDYDYEDSGGVFLRPNHDRYWFRMSHHQPLPYGVEAKLDVDRVSDQDYLQDFKSGYMGFLDTNDYFNKFFGRDLDDFNDPIRVNRLLLSKSWSQYSLNAESRFYDDVRKGQNWKESTQKLPVVRFDAPKQPIADSSTFYNLFSEYTNFWQLRGSRVQRLDLYPRFYYPYALPPYLTLEPSVGLRETLWDQYEADESNSWSDARYFHRELYDTRLSLFTDLYRVYDVAGEDLKRIKHTIRPELGHTYVPEVDQGDLPNIDSRDRVENRSRITYAITSTFTSKSLTQAAEKEEHPRQERSRGTTDTKSDYDYRDFLRLKVSQYYDLAQHEEPFSPIAGRIDLFPGSRISLDSTVKYSVHDTQVELFNTALTLWAREKDRLFVEYRYDRQFREDDADAGDDINELATTTDDEKVNALFTELRIGVTDRFTLLASYEYDFEEEETNQYGIGFSYESQCWSLEALYSRGSEDTGIGVRIRLHGIGGFGL
jgi:LPS-assembly protein